MRSCSEYASISAVSSVAFVLKSISTGEPSTSHTRSTTPRIRVLPIAMLKPASTARVGALARGWAR